VDDLFPLVLLILVPAVLLIFDPANTIGGVAVGLAARNRFFGTSWPLFLGGIVLVSIVAQGISVTQFGSYEVTIASVGTGLGICAVCAMVFGSTVFKLTGNSSKGVDQ